MPNWCNNVAHISHPDKDMLERLKAANDEGGILQEFIPVPKELLDTPATPGAYENDLNVAKFGYPSWYEFCNAEWGTKWDISGELSSDYVLSFDSAWSPPIEAYNKLIGMGFSITAYYYEPGMIFAGIYDNGDNEMFQDFESADELPEILEETFNISEDFEALEEDMKILSMKWEPKTNKDEVLNDTQEQAIETNLGDTE